MQKISWSQRLLVHILTSVIADKWTGLDNIALQIDSELAEAEKLCKPTLKLDFIRAQGLTDKLADCLREKDKECIAETADAMTGGIDGPIHQRCKQLAGKELPAISLAELTAGS